MDQPSPALFNMTAQTMHGLEGVLARELEELGASDITTHNRAVRFRGDEACLYRTNLCLRTALRVLVPIEAFPVRNEDDLYMNIKRMPWERYLDRNDTLAVQCTLSTPLFSHSQYIAQKAKDAIVDRFRDRTGRRPSVDLDLPTVRIHLMVQNDMCRIALDSSDEPLYKRGYRDETNLAPLNEVLAAGMILLSGWDRKSNFVDPMCGSGTIPIEAAMIAANIPPGHDRAQFGFERWKDFDEALWKQVQAEAMANVIPGGPVIIGGEISSNVHRKALSNAHNAGVADRVKILHSAFEELDAPEGGGTLIMNPPYGERMDQDEDINALYKSIGDTLKKKWSGWTAWILTSNLEAAKHVKLTPKPRLQLFNGALDCRFMRYELYSGSRRRDAEAPHEA
jgi:putative N6-adenine-specific DNA methylase